MESLNVECLRLNAQVKIIALDGGGWQYDPVTSLHEVAGFIPDMPEMPRDLEVPEEWPHASYHDICLYL